MSTTKIQILTNAYHDYSSIHGNKTQLKARKLSQKITIKFQKSLMKSKTDFI